MPRRKARPFISKKNATHYTIVRRSQRDPLYHDETSSRYVMRQVGAETIPLEFEAQQVDSSVAAGGDPRSRGKIDLLSEVDALGFKKDGYDYAQHFAVMGEGTFVGLDGKARSGRSHLFPDSAPMSHNDRGTDLGSVPAELPRHLDAITLDASTMDPEIRAALEEDNDALTVDGGPREFEEILDDFVLTASEAPVETAAENPSKEGAFDYDAHVKRLLAEAGKCWKNNRCVM